MDDDEKAKQPISSSGTSSRERREDEEASLANDELENLLESTLADFDNPNLLSSASPMRQPTANVVTSPEKPASTAPPNDEMFNLFNSAVGQISEGDPDLARSLRNLMNAASDVGYDQDADDDDFSRHLSAALTAINGSGDEQLPEGEQAPMSGLLGRLFSGFSGVDKQQDDAGGKLASTSVLSGLVNSMLSKEILYPSLKNVESQYESWLLRHSELSRDVAVYERQLSIIKRICSVFEEESDDPKRSALVLELIQKMEDLGPPPEDLVNSLQFDVELGPD